MSDRQNEDAVKGILESLKRRASELWGDERAQALLPVLEETALNIWRVTREPCDEEPAFYL